MSIFRLGVLLIAIVLIGSMTDGPSNAEGLDHNADSRPTWSPNRNRVAFDSERDDENGDIWTVLVDGTDAHNLTPDSPAIDASPAWSPEGSRLAFVSNRTGEAEIWIMNADGSDQNNLTPGISSSFQRPQWSPDGRLIAFVSRQTQSWLYQIWVVNIETQILTRVSPLNGDTFHMPIWSPDGKYLAFVGGPPWVAGPDWMDYVWVSSIDGEDLRKIDVGAGNVASFDWSPLNKIAIQDRATGLWVYDFGNGDAVNISPDLISHGEVKWSANGELLAYHSDYYRGRGENLDLWVMNPDGSNPVNMTRDVALDKAFGGWSPDSRQITFFNYTISGELMDKTDTGIWIVDVDGSNPVNLSDLIDQNFD